MQFSPLISIIINSYNSAKFIRKTILSILKQDYKNWEIIFWDNNSSDKTGEIIKSFKNKKIKYFKNQYYKKLYHSRNLAIQKCKGDYVTFLDSDDWWKKNKLSEQIKLLNKEKDVKIIYSNFFLYFQKNKLKKKAFEFKLPSGFISKKLLRDYCVGILTVLIKKEILLKNNFNEKYEIIGDFDLFSKLSLKYKFFSIQEPLAYYRIHKNNFSKNKVSLYLNELKDWVSNNRSLFRRKKISIYYPLLLIKKLQIKKILFFLGRVVQW